MSSIRSKMILSYWVLALGVGGFVLFASVNLHTLERQVMEGVTIATFRETVQDLRRHEKNFFLYKATADYQTVITLAEQLWPLLNHPALMQIAQAKELNTLRRALVQYQTLLTTPPAQVETQLRAVGHQISEYSEQLAQRERIHLVQSAQRSRHTLFWAVAVLIVFAWSGGHLLYLTVGKPLQQLEQQLKPLTQGRFQAFQMVSQDRELVSLTQALNRMLEELELRRQQLLQTEKLASLGILASGVAHELNNPLGNISGTSQILLEELTGPELQALPEETRQALQSWLEQIDHETSRAQGIVRALLDYSRKPLPQPALPVALAEILEKSLLLLHHRLPATLEAIQTNIPSELLVRIDPNRLQQVLINLLQNALEAGGAEVEIQIQAYISSPHGWPPPNAAVLIGQPPTTEGVIISFCDHGPGIDPALMPHIFDPFFTTRAPGEGTGLGLYIVSEIIQEQQGCIAVNSPAQGGVCFKLWLPL